MLINFLCKYNHILNLTFFSHFMTVARENILPLFNDVFSAMSIAITDADQNVRTATELLVKLSMVRHTKK